MQLNRPICAKDIIIKADVEQVALLYLGIPFFDVQLNKQLINEYPRNPQFNASATRNSKAIVLSGTLVTACPK